jgi:hypothetical protein
MDRRLAFFVNIGGSRPQLSRRIDTRLAAPLFRLPAGKFTLGDLLKFATP